MTIEVSVAVLGLGYVGLPLVRACLQVGHRVVGFDINGRVVEGLKSGRSHVDDVTNDEIVQWLDLGFNPTTSPTDLVGSDVYVICVPTPLSKDGGPDLAAVEGAASVISAALVGAAPGALVVLESTTYPGTTEEVVVPILECSGLKAGVDFHVAFSPERIDPGNQDWTFGNTPKIVGGLDAASTQAALAFYSPMVPEVVVVKGLKEAEMAKLLENTYRHVNIALINELARLCHEMEIDTWDVIRAAETKPYGFAAFRPGPGVGGHCIPIDPNYLSHRVRSELGHPFRFVELAQEINNSMPAYVVARLQSLLNRHGKPLQSARILLLGVTYKNDIADTRETPATPVVRELRKNGAVVEFWDPFVTDFVVEGIPVAAWNPELADSQRPDAVILLQAHTRLLEALTVLPGVPTLDTRGISSAGNVPDILSIEWERL